MDDHLKDIQEAVQMADRQQLTEEQHPRHAHTEEEIIHLIEVTAQLIRQLQILHGSAILKAGAFPAMHVEDIARASGWTQSQVLQHLKVHDVR